jgi:hypothetical protein
MPLRAVQTLRRRLALHDRMLRLRICARSSRLRRRVSEKPSQTAIRRSAFVKAGRLAAQLAMLAEHREDQFEVAAINIDWFPISIFIKGASFMPAPISKEDAPSMALSQEQDDQNPWTLEKVLLDELKRLRPGVNLNADTMTECVTLQVSTSAKATAPRWESCIWLESISSRACLSSPRSWPQRLNRLVSVDLGPALS